jgi:hypothetical protein
MPTVDGSGNLRRIGRSARPLAAIAVLALLLGMVALPTLAADPSASPDVPGASGAVEASSAPAASAQPEESAEPEDSAEPEGTDEAAETSEPDRAAEPEASGKPEKGPKDRKDKAPEQEITLSGIVTTVTDADGETVYRVQSGGTTYVLEVGPKWFFGDDYPLKPFVGKNVTIVGEVEEGSTEVDVVSVDGTRLREPGKPPWAGGWKKVGERHPGWSEEKAARWAEKQASKAAKFGGCWPPGHCKQQDETGEDVAPTH